jgi:hypothetical protein
MFRSLKEIFSRDKTYPSTKKIERFFEPLEYAGKLFVEKRKELQGALDASKPSLTPTTTISTKWDKEHAKKQIWAIDLLYAQLQVLDKAIEREYLDLLARKGRKGEIVMVEEVWKMLDNAMEKARGEMREVTREVEEVMRRLREAGKGEA